MRLYGIGIVTLSLYSSPSIRDIFQFDPELHCTEHTVVAYAAVHGDSTDSPVREFTMKRARDGCVVTGKKSPST